MPTREAFAVVRNDTNRPLVAVSLLHKYSDNFKNQQQWDIIQPGEIIPDDDLLKVQYNTGGLTTGRDWWLVTWYSPDLKTLYYSNPNNYRDIIDKLESIAPQTISTAVGLVVGLGSGPGFAAASKAAKALAKETTRLLINSESTAGFKQHILRTEDENLITKIVINANHTITLKSKSGNSDTVSASMPTPGLQGRQAAPAGVPSEEPEEGTPSTDFTETTPGVKDEAVLDTD